MTHAPPPMPHPIFHQPVRTRLALALFHAEVPFAKLKSALAITDGNLDAHLKKLGAAGYIHSRMVTDGRPHTVYSLSESGTLAFTAYLEWIAQASAAALERRRTDT